MVSAVLVVGWLYHSIKVVWSVESDTGADKAEWLLRGQLFEDPYHPLLYPIVTAVIGAFVGDVFAASPPGFRTPSERVAIPRDSLRQTFPGPVQNRTLS